MEINGRTGFFLPDRFTGRDIPVHRQCIITVFRRQNRIMFIWHLTHLDKTEEAVSALKALGCKGG